MIESIVSRDDRMYECFPDIALCRDGSLVCVYRECMEHGGFPFSRIALRRSEDGGRTWSARKVIDECITSPENLEKLKHRLAEEALLGYEESKERISDSSKIGVSINCPRILSLRDDQLLLAADYYREADSRWVNLLYRSDDYGVTWSKPEQLNAVDGLVPALTELRDGRIMLGLTRHVLEEGGRQAGSIADDLRLIETQTVFLSENKGKSWSGPIDIPEGSPRHNFSEGSFVELDDNSILGILRDDSTKDRRGYKVLSYDGGNTWAGPYPTQMIGLSGRPKAELLQSGEVCITYRAQLPNKMLALHLMTQESAGFRGDPDNYNLDKPWYLRYDYYGRTVILDMDRSVHYDAGYSGWVQLPSGDIYVVDYINDDAPLAHIRSYLVNRSDVLLFPEGDLPTIAPANQPFVTMASVKAKEQYRRRASTV